MISQPYKSSYNGRTYHRKNAECPCSKPAIGYRCAIPICADCLKIETEFERFEAQQKAKSLGFSNAYNLAEQP